tara:strand:+ start:149 stop:400 length:252 start_codon:yes stop_codon:yes gene_type:complete
MNHKISEFCDKIDSIKKMSDRLRDMKYGPLGASKQEIDVMIETIQADCLLVASDKGKYVKREESNYDYSGVDHPSGLSIDQDE